MGKHKLSVDSQVLRRIRSHGRGFTFTPRDFKDIGTPTAVSLALMRSTQNGTIQKISRGLYQYPIKDPDLGIIPPAADVIANVLKERDQIRLQESGAHAANLLGLSEQVPVRAVYLTDSRSRKIQIGNRKIVLQKKAPRFMATAGRTSGTVISALQWLGRNNVDGRTVQILRNRLSEKQKREMMKDIRYAPSWIASIMRKVSAT